MSIVQLRKVLLFFLNKLNSAHSCVFRCGGINLPYHKIDIMFT